MASQHPPTTVTTLTAKTPGVYDTAKQCFFDLARMLEKGNSPQVFTNDRDVVLILMPSGAGFKSARDLIEGSLKCLKNRLNQQSEWTEVRGKSEDGFFIVLYRAGAFPSKEEAVTFALSEGSKLRQLMYVKIDGDVSAI